MELGRLVSREIHDPRVGFATITEVKLSPDLRHARVFVSVIGKPEQEAESLAAIQAAGSFLRRQLSHAIAMRFTPDLAFELDRSSQQANRIEELLRRTKQ